MPTVSVVIPVYNRADMIERAISSAQSQTFTDIEIVVVDDGSTDDTVQVVQQMPDPRIRLIQYQENRGSGYARNEGLKAAQGKYIAFLDSDDEWLPEKLEKQVALMESHCDDYGMSLTGAKIVKDGEVEVTAAPDVKKVGNVLHLFVRAQLPYLTPTVMLRKSAVDEVGLFDVNLRRGQDSEYFLRIFRKFKLCVLSEALCVVHLVTRKAFPDQVEFARLRIIEMHEDNIRKDLGWYAARQFRAVQLLNIAFAKLRGGQRSKGVLYCLKALSAMPIMPPRRFLMMVWRVGVSFFRRA